MKIAFIGASHWHLPLYLEPALHMPGVTIAGVADPNAQVVGALKAKLGCAGDTDYRALCRRVKPDLVIALGRHCDMPEQARFLIAEKIPFDAGEAGGLNERRCRRDRARGGSRRCVGRGAAGVPPRHVLRDAARGRAGHPVHELPLHRRLSARYRDAGCAWMLDPALSGGGCTINLSPHFRSCGCADGAGRDRASGHAGERRLARADRGLFLRHARARRQPLRDRDRLPVSGADKHLRHALRDPHAETLHVAHDPETIEIVGADGRRERRAVLTTNVPHYATFMSDTIARARAGQPPLASLSDMVPGNAACRRGVCKDGAPLR